MANNSEVKLIYIVGVGRSGTSLLQSMFAAHPEISCLPETSFLRRYVANSVLHSICNSHGLQAVIDWLEADALFNRTKLSAQTLVQRASDKVGQMDGHLYKSMLNAFACKSSGNVVDKDPRSIEFLPLLKAVMPYAQVINIIRDPRDVLASKKRAAWSRSGHVWKHIFANHIQLRLGRQQGKELFGEKYHEVIYEELISSPEEILSVLCGKLGLRYHPKMLNFGEAAKRLVSDSEMSWKKETFGPLLNDNKDKWKKALSCKEIRLTEACCDEAMRLGNYVAACSPKKLAFIHQAWVWLGRILIALFAHPYVFYRKRKLKSACRQLN